eukprot:TRINITY_DN33618_c0_g1_i1.p1 TRINITY_DN33618_c0_g1~~TRINITY_DN33618_c0_g1_i1.p1  ORF type:complete len:888 (+),score=167.09 TRINITY_DN33618_c0_g1_i1:76-2739(+)
MLPALTVGVAMAVLPSFSNLEVPSPSRFAPFLKYNIATDSKMPLSFSQWPRDYYDTIPDGLQTKSFTGDTYVYSCLTSSVSPKGMVNATLMDAYTLQTEKYLAILGLDIYDGALWSIASSILQNGEAVQNYNGAILLDSRTFQLQDIRADKACVGDMYSGQCTDPTQAGACGLCYGDEMKSIDKKNALLFRLIADYWAIQGTVDPRCPDLNHLWTWNDYKPILGENAWALMIGPLTAATKRYGGPQNVPATCTEFQLAENVIPALESLRTSVTDETKPGYGAIYYSVNNAFFYAGSTNPDAGATVSVENQASTLAALRAFDHILSFQPDSYKSLRCRVARLISGLETFLLSAYNGKFFRQGGAYNRTTGVWTWAQVQGQPGFAVDCQTWVASVLGSKAIDSKYGENETYKLWQTMKSMAGYGKQQNGTVKGLGYTSVDVAQFVANSTTDAGPSIVVTILGDSSNFNKSDFTAKVSYIIGESPSFIQVLNSTSGPPTSSQQQTTSVTFVILRQGDATAFTETKKFYTMMNTKGSQQKTYLGAVTCIIPEVFSGEWTFGAINWARVMANESGYSKTIIDSIISDADFMRSSIEQELMLSTPVQSGFNTHPSVAYANLRYYIPFGWWANPLPSMASTSWAVAVDSSFNPLNILGRYSSNYPSASVDCTNPGPPSPTAPPAPAPVPFPQSTHEILSDLYKSAGGDGWFSANNWMSNVYYNPCGTPALPGSQFPYENSWDGVTCDGDGNLISLVLNNNNLTGFIPESLVNLHNLQVLSLEENNLSGNIPTTINTMTSLTKIQLSSNKLSGVLPPLSPLTNLKYFWATGNQFSGLAPDVSGCKALVVYNVNNNMLTSITGDEVFNYENCDLSGNPFKCPIPPTAKTNCYATCT